MMQGNMDEIYKISSTERVQQLEKELATQLAELKTEIEGNGVMQGTPNCSVRLPKDIDYFRRERELALKKCLQVAEAKPLVIQADILQRELESCLKREYTPESLPLLLHQKQVAHIMQEYNDAVQRAVRLSSARENFLTGKENPTNLVTQEDLTIYTQWLICHLHSLKPIHNYLWVLQYLPISHRTEVAVDRQPSWNDGDAVKTLSKTEFLSSNIQLFVWPSTSVPDGALSKDATFALPQHSTEIEELKPQLRLLLSQFGINYDVENLRHSANEMELFSVVVQKFRSIFSKQQTMRTFPVYDVGNPGSENWSMVDSKMALKKKANWIPFIKIKAKQDPWQQKQLMKLKQWKKLDEMLLVQSKFLQISNLDRVMETLQEQAAAVLEPKPVTSGFMTSSNLQQYDQIWEKVYHNPEFHQEQQTNGDDDNPVMANVERGLENSYLKEGSTFSRKKKDTSHTTTLQLLGLDEGMDSNDKDLVPRKGAYLSLFYLRHLRIRELQIICLGILNYFRSIERTLTISTSGLTLNAGQLVSTAEDSCWVNAAKGGTGAFGGLGSHAYVHFTPADYKVHSVQFMEFAEVENHDDFYTVEDMYIHIQDQRGAFVIYDVALQDLKELERQLLLVATQYIEREKGHKAYSDSNNSNYLGWAHTSVDRSAVLLDLWTCETGFLENKRQLLDCYFEAYQHALALEERFALAQVVTDVMYRRPRFDFDLEYFVNIYKDECICLRLETQLVRGILNQQIDNQRDYNHKIWHDGPKGGIHEFGFPPYIVPKQLIAVNNSPTALKNIYLLEFHPSLGLVSLISKSLGHVLQEFQQICRPKTAKEAIKLDKQVLQLALDTWMTLESPGSFYGSQTQKELFTEVLIEDPSLVKEIAASALKSVIMEEQNKGNKEKQILILNIFSRLLELLVLRYRLIEAALESAQMGRLYKEFAGEMGFDEFHLYLRPVYFEFATHKETGDQPASMLLNPYGVGNLQIALACQVTHKNTLLVAIQQAAFCPMMQPTRTVDMKEGGPSQRSQSSSASGRSATVGNELEDQPLATAPLSSYFNRRFLVGHCNLRRMNHRISQYSLRSQITAYYNSIRAMLNDFPSVRAKYFIIGLPQEKKGERESKGKLGDDPREAFLSSGNVCAYQSITDNIYHGLPPLSNAIVGNLLASQLPLPKPLDQHSHRLCLCGLNDEDRKTVHGELVEMQFIIEDVLWSNCETLSDVRIQQTSFKKSDPATIAEGSRKASETPVELRDSAAACASQKSYLILWKQLETLKAEWGRLKMKVEDINTVALYKQFSELYDAEILYPAMRSLARHRGIEEGFGATSQSILPPKEASEVEIKTYQIAFQKDHLQNCLTALGCDVMARERSNFETYSMFYENILHRQHQLLYQKEQEIDAIKVKGGDAELGLSQGKVDEYRLNLSQCMFEIISEVRREGVNKMIALKKKIGSTKDNNSLKQYLAQGRMLQEVEHKMNQEVCRRQQLDLIKTENLEKMLEKLGERELRLQCLTEEAEKSTKIQQLQEEKVKKEIQRIRSQLTLERSFKLNAFQRVDELQSQLYNLEAMASQSHSRTGTILAGCSSL
ncbi:hypothetical protein JD844_024313 [Phrynosoma platyrhinos]|uniref:DUF4549 domain-containing protein n=1 Tax=Phrynosoma platyrhinos TaxID=52577 RepID=A0ABQ7SY66_PHRPL|nr:hypothetical protein JD844_024313 [Phrynosoma platyrhinos]